MRHSGASSIACRGSINITSARDNCSRAIFSYAEVITNNLYKEAERNISFDLISQEYPRSKSCKTKPIRYSPSFSSERICSHVCSKWLVL